MIDEDMALDVLDKLAAATPEAVKALDGAVLVRPKPDRFTVAGVDDPSAAAMAWRGEEVPASASWWLSLTSWGRLGMGGDMIAAAAWLRRQSPSAGEPAA